MRGDANVTTMMDIFLLWLGLGLVLIVAELLTGTLYLLILGLAALVTAVVAYLAAFFWL